MSGDRRSPARAGVASRACEHCARRAWLLAELSVALDYCSRDPERYLRALDLGDRSLVQALGGRRRAELLAALERPAGSPARPSGSPASICPHGPGFPQRLRGESGPRALFLTASAGRLEQLTEPPVVVLAGTTHASDYGRETAGRLAREAATAGLTVAAPLAEGIGAAALDGAGGAAIAVLGSGIEVQVPASLRAARSLVGRAGCCICELPDDCAGRRFGPLAAERILAALAAIVVVVEAGEDAARAPLLRRARDLGRPLAAVPGRVTSAAAAGPHALLRDGATLVRDGSDLLDALDAARSGGVAAGLLPARSAPEATRPALPEPLATVLGRVGDGCDTPDRLRRSGLAAAAVLAALTELELRGLLMRVDGGRYLPREVPQNRPDRR